MDDLIEKYLNVLEDDSKDENDIQKFLEENTELIPLPFIEGHQLHQSVVISKLPVGNGYVSDFAYLTKCSDYWDLVLIEIENPKKRIFLKSTERIRFTAEFNDAYEQILSWKAYLENDNRKEDLIKRVKKLMISNGLENNPVYIKYVLIYGRRQEKKDSERRINMFNQKNTNDIKVKTFDSLISEYECKAKLPKLILSPWKENGFKIKLFPDKNVETWLFSYLNSDYIKISKSARENLIAQGYCIEEWENGEYLTEDGKMDKITKYNSLPDNHLYKKMLERELKEKRYKI